MKNLRLPLFLLGSLGGLALAEDPAMSAADTAWMLTATGLVLLMTPALAFFYGGLVRSKNVLNTMMMSFSALGFVGVAWALLGYTLALSGEGNFIGDLRYALLSNVGLENKGAIASITIPHLLWMVFQGTFAIITAALVSGAIVERMRFPAFLLFITLWSLVVYAPIAKWVWGGGFLADLGAWDFAGGTVVHINAGIAALVAALVLGPRKDFGRQAILPHNVPFVLLGAAFLWLGWFGFNAGSAWAANATAGLALANTILAPAATLVVWSLLELSRTGRVTAVGLATAIVVGLVVITPAAAFVAPIYALAMGALGAFPSYFALLWRAKSGLDDSLDVFAAHGVAGMAGAVLTGVFAQESVNGLFNGLIGGNPAQVFVQAFAVLIAVVYSAGMTFLLLKLVGALIPLKALPKEEGLGMDVTQHGEEAYTSGEGAILVRSEAPRPSAQPKPVGGTD
ncbi:Ammonia channel [Meiothermus luteus]|jgi:Amt family ammonium transporter|uniref:Ammonium transporter n=1 Tax=Meiothermus luteus TaxID=2026184 RepID=A0A399EN64_9DEIN|nr:ammonium transporter [Meiothermus luteus]RIH83591.1 Ammonia channel [Meiothermus luteus]RMH56406.1 MAG: ammonium transporter [Deinococcota bacterium]